MRRCLLLLPVLLLACNAGTETLGGTDAGSAADANIAADAGESSDAGATCTTLDEAACALANCNSLFCEDCEGRSTFTACFGTTPVSCPALDCPPPCADLNQAECAAAADRCTVDVCPGCREPDFFIGCRAIDAPPSPCPPVFCPPCEELEANECGTDPGCHMVFGVEDPDECLCDSPGCCHEFIRCAEGRYADCRGDNLACRIPAPWCDGPYVVSYEGMCYEGCVRAEDCSP